MLSRYGRIPDIPADAADWDVEVRGAARLARTLRERLDDALLFRRIATVDPSAPTAETVDELRWAGPVEGFSRRCAAIGAERLADRAHRLAADKAPAS